MKRLLAAVLVFQMGMFLCGCEKKVEESTWEEEPADQCSKIVVSVDDPAPPAEPNINRGLVAWWKLDEPAGVMAADSSGQGRDGELKGEGSPSFDSSSAEGQIGKALNVGEGDYVEITGYKGILGTAPRTVAAWIKTKRNKGKILSWGKREPGMMFVFGFARGHIGVTPSWSAEGSYLYIADRVEDDEWHHVAAVVREAELPNLEYDVTLYKDGEVGILHNIGLLALWPIDTPSGMDVAIGRGYEGAVDEVRVYDRALSEEEIRLLFKAK
jgi:hypothetical protein